MPGITCAQLTLPQLNSLRCLASCRDREQADHFCQRDLAAFLAIADRFLADRPAARALPPIRPSATAAAFLPSSVVRSSTSPVAILPTMTALPITSAGRFSPLGPLGINARPLWVS